MADPITRATQPLVRHLDSETWAPILPRYDTVAHLLFALMLCEALGAAPDDAAQLSLVDPLERRPPGNAPIHFPPGLLHAALRGSAWAAVNGELAGPERGTDRPWAWVPRSGYEHVGYLIPHPDTMDAPWAIVWAPPSALWARPHTVTTDYKTGRAVVECSTTHPGLSVTLRFAAAPDGGGAPAVTTSWWQAPPTAQEVASAHHG